MTLLLLFATAAGCDRGANLSDLKVGEFADMFQQDRPALGLPDLPANAPVTIEVAANRPYDAMLHVGGNPSRTVAFKRTVRGYDWVGEQVTCWGPNTYTTVDGTSRENLVIEYQTVPINGVALNQLVVSYSGTDSQITRQKVLTGDVARQILQKWGQLQPARD